MLNPYKNHSCKKTTTTKTLGKSKNRGVSEIQKMRYDREKRVTIWARGTRAQKKNALQLKVALRLKLATYFVKSP